MAPTPCPGCGSARKLDASGVAVCPVLEREMQAVADHFKRRLAVLARSGDFFELVRDQAAVDHAKHYDEEDRTVCRKPIDNSWEDLGESQVITRITCGRCHLKIRELRELADLEATRRSAR